MARIRSIKPEISQSETLAACSRDARLAFIYLVTISDDFGRIKGSPKLLARQIFPLDDDAPGLIDSWFTELENAKCLVRYVHDGQNYIYLPGWKDHQKVDKPTPSKLPPPPDSGASEQTVAKPDTHQGEESKARAKPPKVESPKQGSPPEKLAKPRESSRQFSNPRDKLAKPRESSRLARDHDLDLDQDKDLERERDQEKDQEKSLLVITSQEAQVQTTQDSLKSEPFLEPEPSPPFEPELNLENLSTLPIARLKQLAKSGSRLASFELNRRQVATSQEVQN